MSIFDKDIIQNEEDINRLKAWNDFCKAISEIDKLPKNTVATFMITNSQIADEFKRLCEEDNLDLQKRLQMCYR